MNTATMKFPFRALRVAASRSLAPVIRMLMSSPTWPLALNSSIMPRRTMSTPCSSGMSRGGMMPRVMVLLLSTRRMVSVFTVCRTCATALSGTMPPWGEYSMMSATSSGCRIVPPVEYRKISIFSSPRKNSSTNAPSEKAQIL